MIIPTKAAVETLIANLKGDPSLFIAWQANIAMAMYDVWYPKFGSFYDPKPTVPEMNLVFNDGATRFLNLLCENNGGGNLKSGAERIAQERWEQVEKHGFRETDVDYRFGELISAALFSIEPTGEFENYWPEGWQAHFKQKIQNKSRIDQLTVAGAFIAAEIDRMLVAMQHEPPEPGPITEAPPAEPTTLDEVVEQLLPAFDGFLAIAPKGEDNFAAFCHSQLSGGVGVKIRNRYNLWVHESPLHQYFLTEHNLFEPDSMSDLIIRHIYNRLTQPTNEQL